MTSITAGINFSLVIYHKNITKKIVFFAGRMVLWLLEAKGSG